MMCSMIQKNLSGIALFLFFSVSSIAQINHAAFDRVLKAYVSEEGWVNYSGLKAESGSLDAYLKSLEANQPAKDWSKNASKAYWINAYNAYTLKLMIDHYPLKSITDLKEPWDRKWINLKNPNSDGSDKMSLNDIEHGVLRSTYSDARIHAGINCASASCPPLANVAFTENNCDELLQQLMTQFVNDPVRNSITDKKASISQIFEWFQEDFTQEKKISLIDYLNQYSEIKLDSKAKVSYKEYDWSINGS